MTFLPRLIFFLFFFLIDDISRYIANPQYLLSSCLKPKAVEPSKDGGFVCVCVHLQRLSGSHKALVEMQDDVAELLRSATQDYASTKVCVLHFISQKT